MIKKINHYFTKSEIILWSASVILILLSFIFFDRGNYMPLAASLIGVTSLIFNAKGNPFGQFLIIIFSILYGIISYSFSYYGEMITYLGMTMPMAVLSLISWLKNPYHGNKSSVKINKIKVREIIFMFVLAAFVTLAFYYILKAFHTNNLFFSTLSITTSFIAAYLTFRRSSYFAIAYALNDIVLITLWSLAAVIDITYISVTICFVIFLINDIYGFVNWIKMEKKQKAE